MDWPLSGWVYGTPFPIGDMDWSLSGLGYGPAPFPHLLFPNSPGHFMAARCIYVYFERGTLSYVHGDTFGVSAVEHQFLPLESSDLFCYLLWS